MSPSLEQESERLARSWMSHDPAMLRDYLVAGVEDPRLNLQSVLSRHFLLEALGLAPWRPLMEEECRFASAMNWLAQLAERAGHEDELAAVLHALKKGGDNAEGIEIPSFMTRTFALLPAAACGLPIPNYIEAFLSDAQARDPRPGPRPSAFDAFASLWRAALAGKTEAGAADAGRPASPALSVLEPACGSANDYRGLEACGIVPLIHYHGFDLCPANIANARALFPGVSFETGNVFAIPAPDKSFDVCFVHDLFEHFSPAGIEAAVSEVCRVTRRGLGVGFFNMDEIPAHEIRPLREYHWNRLSLAQMKEQFAAHGFAAQALNIGVFLRHQFGCDQTHNPNAHTFFLRPAGDAGG